MIALTGVVTISANFVANSFRAEQDLSGLLTKIELDASLVDNNTALQANLDAELAKLQSSLDEQKANADAGRTAISKKHEFQYGILSKLLDIPEEETRARLLLFYVNAGAMEGLQIDKLREMANTSIRDSGGDPDKPQGVPTAAAIPADQKLLYEVLGEHGRPNCPPPLKSLDLPFEMTLSYDTSIKVKTILVHEAALPYFDRLFIAVVEQGLEHEFQLYGGVYNARTMRGSSVLSVHSWGVAIDIDPLGNPLRTGRDRAAISDAAVDLFVANGFAAHGRRYNYNWGHFELSDNSLLEIQKSGYVPWNGQCPDAEN